MDKPRGMRRGASRSRLRAKQSVHKLYDGDFDCPVKSKKEKVKSLTAVGRALSSCEENKMGCEKEDALRMLSPSSNTKRFKISKRFFDDGNGVGHASVPRKLRSVTAVKKRNREFSLHDSEKVSHKLNGIESPLKGGMKKAKVKMQQGSPGWSSRQTVSGPITITKDEEEVVETLYALAGMFLNNNDSNERLKLEGDSSPENSNLQDSEKSINDAFEGSGTGQDPHPFCAERSSGEAAITHSSIDSIDRKQPDFIENAELMTSDSIAPNLNLDTTMPMLIRNENGNEVALDDSELSLAVGSSMPRHSPKLRDETKPETAGAVESKQVYYMKKDLNSKDGPTLWPGLALATSARSQASYLQSSAAKAPIWPDDTRCTSKHDLTQGVSSDARISEAVFPKKLWKSCVAHVYISNFIRRLQVQNSKDALQQANHSNQPRANEGSRHVNLIQVRNLNRARSGITSAPGPGHSDIAKKLHDNKNSILQHSFSYHEPLTPDVHGPQKQGLDLLSLSAGGNGLKVNNKLDESGGSRFEPLPKLQMPYFQPLAQLQGLMRFPVPQSQYASPSYLTHQISAAGPQVLPHYYSNSLWIGHNSSTATNNKLQQQSFWAMQVAAQGQGSSGGVNCNIMRPQYPKWENGRQDSVVNHPAMIPQSSASLQVVGSKFASISEQQQQQFISLASSLPQSRTNNGLNFLVPPVCEQSRGRFPGSHGTLPSLQLLCDDRI